MWCNYNTGVAEILYLPTFIGLWAFMGTVTINVNGVKIDSDASDYFLLFAPQ